jgi:copper transport protein
MRFRRLVAAALLGTGLSLGVAEPAAAHAVLLASEPVPGQRLDRAPAEVVLIFSEPVTDARVSVLDGGGQLVSVGRTRFADSAHRRVVGPLRTGLPNGVYVVSWQAVSADSHPVRGGFSFGVGVDAPLGSDVSTTTAGPLLSVGYATARWTGFVGIAIGLGGLVFLLFVWPEGITQRAPRLIVQGGLAVALLASVGQLLLQPAYADQSLTQAIDTEFGYLVLARIELLAASLVLAVMLFGRLCPRWPIKTAALALAAGVLMTWPLTGHARAADPVWLAVTADLAHLAAAVVWLGGAAMLVVAVLHGRPIRANTLPVVARFSPLALGCVAVIASTGTYQAWREVGTPPALLATRYGLLLTAKIGLFAVIFGLGIAARLWIRGRWGGQPAGLRRSVSIELATATIILALTSVLVATPPARDTYTTPLHTTVNAGANRLEVRVEPARVGSNAVQVRVLGAGGTPVDVAEVRLRIRLTNPDVGPLPLTVHRIGTGEFVAHEASFPFPGRWQLTIGVRTGEFDLTNAAVDVTVH